MKAISAELAEHYASGSTTLAKLFRTDRLDGTVLGFTDHDVSIPYLGLLYTASSGTFDASAVATRSELNVANVTVQGLLVGAGITAADIEAGLWDGAKFSLVEVNYRDLTMGHNPIRYGEFGQLQRKAGQYVAELRGLTQHYQNVIGRIMTAACDATLGDARCGVDLETFRVSATVTATASRRELTAADLIDSPDTPGYYDYGEVTWTTGLNAGLRMEVKRHLAGGVLELQLQMAYPISALDEFTIVPGCNKIHRVVDSVAIGDCKNKYDNVLNFRGFDDIPGPDQILLVGGQ